MNNSWRQNEKAFHTSNEYCGRNQEYIGTIFMNNSWRQNERACHTSN